MSEFDFDEIDKAVNGALGSTPASETPAINGVSTPASSRGSADPTPAARRSSGRFMDMVHPASDMRPSRPDTATTIPSRPLEAPAPRPAEPTTPPIEDPAKPLESPFLPDAKVEKRPLGGTATAVDEPLLEAPDDPKLEAHAMPDPIDFAAQNEVATESEEPKVEASETPEPAAVEVDTPHSEPTQPAEDIPTGPASITQQYKEQPSSTPESGAIYDTEAYHQPLPKAAKKRSGAWIILWILILVILGAAAGAAFYLYILPLL